MTIKSIEEYIAIANKTISDWQLSNSSTHIWFRGQGSVDWGLTPKIYRKNSIDALMEREYLRDFKLLANNFIDKNPKDDFEWLFIMQHYGMPTRLLDWTESHLVALFFAVEDYSNSDDCAVWLLDPWSLNKVTLGEHSVPIHTHNFLKKYVLPDTTKFVREVKGEYPVCLRASKTTPRILAQKGNFSIHGKVEDCLFDYSNSSHGSNIRLKKIIIDGKSKLKILKQLTIAGITHSVLFPDLDGLAKEVAFRYSHEYMTSNIQAY